MKVAVVYWSGTGNTEAMAKAVLQGVKEAGAEGTLMSAVEFAPVLAEVYDAIAFGCPSMGVESLEDGEFEPMFKACEPSLAGKKLALSVPMAGGTESGCATGKTCAAPMAPSSSARA